MWPFRKKYTIHDLNTPTLKTNRIGSSRNKYKIIIIDDEPFTYYDELTRAGFSIVKKQDIENLEDVEAYHIIISDIKGVGKNFSSKFEGAMLIRELKKKYPFKVFAAYTGSTYDPLINSYLEGVSIIKKDIEIDDWVVEIDALIYKVSDPQHIWTRILEILLAEKVPLSELAELESEYVDIILNKDGNFHNFPSKKLKRKINEDIMKIICSFISKLLLTI